MHWFLCFCIMGIPEDRAAKGSEGGGQMIKVLLIDDEKMALEYLENIISWEMYGFEVVGALTDAKQALKVFRRTRPDLVISDVYMQGMDGLDFAGAIREIDQSTHILFLSGYKSFDYVKEAIRLGIDDYLLKSDMDEELLLAKILNIKEKIEKEQQKKQYTEGMIFKELFLKNIEEREYRGILGEAEYIHLHKKYYYLILSLRHVPGFLEEYLPGICQEEYLDELYLKSLIHREAGQEGLKDAAAFAINTAEMLAVLEVKGDVISRKEIYEKLYRLSDRIFGEVNRKGEAQFNLFFYPTGCAVRQFRKYYRENRDQLNQCYVKQKPQIMELGTGETTFSTGQPEANVSSEQIYEAVKSADSESLETYIETILIAIEQEDYVTYLWYVKEIMRAMSRLEMSFTGERSGQGFCLAESVGQYDMRNPCDMVKFFQYKFEEIKKVCGAKQGGAYSNSIQEAVNYIRKNYGREDLSVNLVAKQVNLSVSWLSTKFKEEAGIGVNDYLNKIRIQRAKQLFDEQDYMIYEVAGKVGFTSSQYFSKIFKQITGVTPNEYRRMNRKKQG